MTPLPRIVNVLLQSCRAEIYRNAPQTLSGKLRLSDINHYSAEMIHRCWDTRSPRIVANNHNAEQCWVHSLMTCLGRSAENSTKVTITKDMWPVNACFMLVISAFNLRFSIYRWHCRSDNVNISSQNCSVRILSIHVALLWATAPMFTLTLQRLAHNLQKSGRLHLPLPLNISIPWFRVRHFIYNFSFKRKFLPTESKFLLSSVLLSSQAKLWFSLFLLSDDLYLEVRWSNG